MRKLLLIATLLIACCSSAVPQVLITEVQSGNASTIYGIDGRNDWVEIYNTGSNAVNLNQWGLSDDPADPYKWRFPNINIDPLEHIIVWAGGLDQPYPVDHWEMPVKSGDTWKYFVGTSEPPTTWARNSFDDSGWDDGVTPIGYGDPNIATTIPATVSLYMRIDFNIADLSKLASAVLAIDYDDAYIAYINNIEVCRYNVDPDRPNYLFTANERHEGIVEQGGLPEMRMLSLQDMIGSLRSGNNVLAIQVINTDITSTDMISIPYLAFGIKDGSTFWNAPPAWFQKGIQLMANFKIDAGGETITLTNASGAAIDQWVVPALPVNYSYMRVPDGSGTLNYSDEPTPGYGNTSANYALGITPTPVFSLAPGFYPGSVQVSISSSLTGSTIYYTKNGNDPTTSDYQYTGPVSISQTTVLRARVFKSSGYLPGEITTGTYIINFDSPLPVVSLQTERDNLWNVEKGIYVKGPGASATFPYKGANYWWNKRVPGHIEYYGKDHQLKFAMDHKLSIDGNWTKALPQKTFLIEAKTYYANSTINYQLVPHKPINKFKSFRLRNSGSDWMDSHFRDALTHRAVSYLGQDIQEYDPVNLFLNGTYWGIANVREISDEDYLEQNHNVNPDSVDIIKVTSANYVNCGTQTAFYDMVDYVSSHSFSGSTGIQQMNQVWDLDNFTDWFILQTYMANEDWVGDWTNNIKLWRENKQSARWRMFFYDLDQGSLAAWLDKLAEALHPADSNFYTYMTKKMLNNPTYENYFINRYADIINTTFVPSRMNNLIDGFHDSIMTEMPHAISRWGDSLYSVNNMNGWDSVVNRVRNFYNWRPDYARDYIEDEFNLDGQVDVTLAVEPANAGLIKISTIIPDSLPWTGVYFDGNPVTFTAIPNPGFTFQNWKPCHTFSSANTNQTINYNIGQDDSIIARFTGTPAVAKLSFSEIAYHPDSTHKSGDWVELHNYGTVDVNLTGWHLKDSSLFNDYVIPTGTVIPSGGYLVFVEDTAKFRAEYPGIPVLGPTGLGLKNSSEEISLYNNANDLIISVRYNDSIPWPMCADGLGTTLELRNDTLDPNLGSSWFDGCVGGSPGGPFVPCNYDIIFSEVNYKSNVAIDGGDWIELHNTTASPIDVSGYKLSDDDDAHTWTIPAGTVIAANGYLVLVSDFYKFISVYVWAGYYLGSFNFGLGSSGDAVRLYKDSGPLYNAMIYRSAPPWPDAAGTGYTLEGYDTVWNKSEPDAWFLGCWGGSPGFPYHQPCDFGIEENQTPGSMRIYPNPAGEQFTVAFPEVLQDEALLSIYDINGRVVLNMRLAGSGRFTIPRGNLNGSLYYVRVVTEHGTAGSGVIVFGQ